MCGDRKNGLATGRFSTEERRRLGIEILTCALRRKTACASRRGGLLLAGGVWRGLRAVPVCVVGHSVGAATRTLLMTLDKMESSDPSCNTDQGVQHTCECGGGKNLDAE